LFGQGLTGFEQAGLILLILVLIIRKIHSHVFNIEAGLVLGAESDDLFIQAGLAMDEDELVFGLATHFLSNGWGSRLRSNSGETLSWPILSALSAISRKAWAINLPESMPELARACSTL
jgi:uncharacterized membrane protein YhhN